MNVNLPRRAALAGLTGLAMLMRSHSSLHAQPAAAASLADQLAAYANSLSYADLGPAIVELVKAHFIDSIGCAIAAFNQPRSL